jgi:asparagine synthase (glutamine-hydrolysing)
MQTLLSGNLLSSQGDRMMMGNSVEGRFPFLDYRLIEFCARLPAQLRLNVLREKYLLKKIARPYLPGKITGRVKQAYRAPEAASFLHAGKLEYVRELLSDSRVRRTDYFDPAGVAALVSKCSRMDTASISARDNMALVLVVTTLLLDQLFIRDFSVDYGTRKRDNAFSLR